MVNNIIETFDLTKKFKLKGNKKELVALNKVNFTIKEGEIFGLLGPDVLGKSTLLQIFTTMLKPTSGYAKIEGINILKKPKCVRKKIGVMLGAKMLYPKLTCYENLKFFCKIYNVPNYKEKIHSILEEFGLAKWLNQYVENFSSGMKMKLAFCRTLLLDRKILLLDEPTLGLDTRTTSLIVEKLKNLKKTILLTTSNIKLAEELCDRIGFIKKGYILTDNNQELNNLVNKLKHQSYKIETNNNVEEVKTFKTKAWGSTEKAQNYERSINSNFFVNRIKNKVEYFYAKKFVASNILDAGAGTGRFSLPLLSEGNKVLSCDISYPMLSIAYLQNSMFKGIVADVFNLPFKNGHFDSIISITVLEHFIDYPKIIGEFNRIIKKKGVIIFEMPNRKNYDYFREKKLRSRDNNFKAKNYYSLATVKMIRKILNDYQLELLHFFPYDFFNNNQILKRVLLNKRIYSLFLDILDKFFAIPWIEQFYYLVEIHLLKYLPDCFCFNIMYVARKKE